MRLEEELLEELELAGAEDELLEEELAGAELLLDGVATFTCTELCSYESFIFYAVLTNVLYLKRPDLKKKIVDGPEVLGVIHLPQLDPLPVLVNGLYDCEYAGFFNALVYYRHSSSVLACCKGGAMQRARRRLDESW